MIIHCLSSFVNIETSYSIEELSTLLSKHYFGSIKMVHTDYYHGLPALTLEYEILGILLLLSGGDGRYTLKIRTSSSIIHRIDADERSNIYLDDYIVQLVNLIDGIRAYKV